MKYTFTIVPCRGTCEPICFKLGMKMYTTLQFDSSLNDSDVHSRSQNYEKARKCAAQMYMMYIKGDKYEEVLYGEYESFDQLLLLFYIQRETISNWILDLRYEPLPRLTDLASCRGSAEPLSTSIIFSFFGAFTAASSQSIGWLLLFASRGCTVPPILIYFCGCTNLCCSLSISLVRF